MLFTFTDKELSNQKTAITGGIKQLQALLKKLDSEDGDSEPGDEDEDDEEKRIKELTQLKTSAKKTAKKKTTEDELDEDSELNEEDEEEEDDEEVSIEMLRKVIAGLIKKGKEEKARQVIEKYGGASTIGKVKPNKYSTLYQKLQAIK